MMAEYTALAKKNHQITKFCSVRLSKSLYIRIIFFISFLFLFVNQSQYPCRHRHVNCYLFWLLNTKNWCWTKKKRKETHSTYLDKEMTFYGPYKQIKGIFYSTMYIPTLHCHFLPTYENFWRNQYLFSGPFFSLWFASHHNVFIC